MDKNTERFGYSGNEGLSLTNSKKESKEEEKPVEKSIDNDILIKNDYTKWL